MDQLDMFKERLSPETYQSLLCDETYVTLLGYVDANGTITNERQFMSSVIFFARLMQEHIKDHMPPAWGEDS